MQGIPGFCKSLKGYNTPIILHAHLQLGLRNNIIGIDTIYRKHLTDSFSVSGGVYGLHTRYSVTERPLNGVLLLFRHHPYYKAGHNGNRTPFTGIR